VRSQNQTKVMSYHKATDTPASVPELYCASPEFNIYLRCSHTWSTTKRN